MRHRRRRRECKRHAGRAHGRCAKRWSSASSKRIQFAGDIRSRSECSDDGHARCRFRARRDVQGMQDFVQCRCDRAACIGTARAPEQSKGLTCKSADLPLERNRNKCGYEGRLKRREASVGSQDEALPHLTPCKRESSGATRPRSGGAMSEGDIWPNEPKDDQVRHLAERTQCGH